MLNDIIEQRKKKLANLIKAGLNPYPSSVKRTASLTEVLEKFQSLAKKAGKNYF